MAKWIEWIPEMAHGVHQQLLSTAGKHSGVIWLIEPPPLVRVATSPVMLDGIQHYIDEGGVPIGWIDLEGNVHNFKLQAPFEPPDFKINVDGMGELPYEFFWLSKELISDLYDQLCLRNIGLTKRVGRA
jgi:hypothetical protein